MPTTTNFGWTTPADTDLVKDGASAMRTLAGGIDTSMAQLKGGTTGQILSKTSNTDMAFTWINNDQGDITAVTAGTGLSGGGTAGAVTLAIDTATTVDLSTAQTLTNKNLSSATNTFPTSLATLTGTQTLTNKTISGSSNTISNVSLTSSVTGTLPIANGGTNLTTFTTGDIPYASASNTLSKLGIGTNGQILTVSSGVPAWSTPSSSGALTLITSDSFTSITSKSYNNCFSSTYLNYLILLNVNAASNGNSMIVSLKLRSSGTDNSSGYAVERIISNFNGLTRQSNALGTGEAFVGIGQSNTYYGTYNEIKLMNPFATQGTGIMSLCQYNESGGTTQNVFGGVHNNNSSFDGFTIFFTSSTTGTLQIYGYGK